MSPVYTAPEGGYKIPKAKVIPGIPPCLEKHGDHKTKWMRDKAQAASALKEQDKAVHPRRASRGRSAKLAKADQKLQLQQQEIDALEKQVEALSEHKERSVVKKARQQSLSQLRERAAHLLDEVKAREAVKHHASSQKLLLHSVSALTKDMTHMNAKVDKLAKAVEKKNDVDAFGAEVGCGHASAACRSACVLPRPSPSQLRASLSELTRHFAPPATAACASAVLGIRLTVAHACV